MADDIERNLDLEKILATLANLPKTEVHQYQDQQQGYDLRQSLEGTHDDQQIRPLPQHLLSHQPLDPRLANRPAPQHRQPPLKTQDQASTPLIDPSTIIEWKQGLRCVSKVAAQNQEFAGSIRKLIKDQEQNVKAWEAGRTRLIEDQRLKRENEQTHRAALSLPGLLEGAALLRTPECEKEELEQYDAKVYRASKAMVDSQALSLKSLGVPFFGVKPHLVILSDESSTNATEAQPAQVDGKITREKLLEMQRKMLNHLMELYGD